MANLRLYVDLCDLMSIDLRDAYLFRSTNKKGPLSNKPFIGSATANRLSLHLATLRLHNGEIMHNYSFRGGCSITMSLIGVSPEDIARHVGCKSFQTAEYYMQTGKVVKMSHAASPLADSTSTVEGDPSAAISVANPFSYQKRIARFFSHLRFLRSLLDLVLQRVVICFPSFGESIIKFLFRCLLFFRFDCFRAGVGGKISLPIT